MNLTMRVVWLQHHIAEAGCWCRPHVEPDDVHHRQIILRPDSRERAFVLHAAGVPA